MISFEEVFFLAKKKGTWISFSPNNENFSWNITRRRWFMSFTLFEQLCENPIKSIVIWRSKDLKKKKVEFSSLIWNNKSKKKNYLGNKCSSWSQKFTRKFQSVQSQLGLSERIMKPGATHVWRTIVQHNVNFPFTQMTLQFSTTIFQKEFWFNFLKEKQKQIKIKFKKNPK